MIGFFKKNLSGIYIIFVYLLILFQYPAGMIVGNLFLHRNIESSMQPNYLILWGMVRILIVIPLLLTLLTRDNVKHDEIYLSFGNYQRVIAITFWGTFAFTILGMFLYPSFINSTKLTVLTFIEYLPIFMLYAVSNAFVEETFFRGISLHFLTEKSNFWIANLIQAFFFSLIHFTSPMSPNPWLFVMLTFFLGLLWGLLTKKYKSLVPAIALHVIADIFVAISLF